MGDAGRLTAASVAAPPRTRAAARGVAPGDAAWLALVPCALVLLAAVLVVGPPLGQTLFPPLEVTWLPDSLPGVIREPTEQGRYLLALAGPLLIAGVVLAAPRLPRPPTAVMSIARQSGGLLLAGFVVACLAAQRVHEYSVPFYFEAEPVRRTYFTAATLIAAALLVLLGVLALSRPRVIDRIGAWTRETTATRLAATAFAGLFLAAWLLTAVNTEDSIGSANEAVLINMPFWLDETFAVLNGRTPLVDFQSQYAQLWPFLAAAAMTITGTSLGAYTLIMTAGAAASLLLVLALLRRIVRRSLLALALWAPFVATGFFLQLGPLHDRYGPSNLFSLFPMRYAGPYLLAWLLARHLDGARPRSAWPLFLAGGLVAVNNAEFGIAALGALIAALLWGARDRSPRRLAVLGRDAAIGLLGAAALVSLLTLATAGELPRVDMLFTFSRLWGLGGFTLLPMPAVGLHLVLYLTFAAAIVAATVRAAERHEGTVLTGMLVWSGVFGLGSSSYFVGRSHPEVLIGMFSAWALALALLLIVVVDAVLRRASRRPTVAEALVLVGFGVSICSLAQTPTPWSQVERIADTGRGSPYEVPADVRFIDRATRPGERVVILNELSHRIAHQLGLTNVSPYVSSQSMPAAEQVEETIDALRAARGTSLFLPPALSQEAIETMLSLHGLRRVATEPSTGLAHWVDDRGR